MTESLTVQQQDLRRFLLSFQGLNPLSRAEPDLAQLIRNLECVQIDPVSLVGRNQDLALLARHDGYRAGSVDVLLARGIIFEYSTHAACLLPIEDFPVLKGVRARRRQQLQREMDDLGSVIGEVLTRLHNEGPLTSRAFESPVRVQGYWDGAVGTTKATSHALNLLRDAGMIRVVGRDRSLRTFDLAARGLDAEVARRNAEISEDEADQALFAKYLRAFRVVTERDPLWGWKKTTLSQRRSLAAEAASQEVLVPVKIQETGRSYYLRREDIGRLESCMGQEPYDLEDPALRVRFLPPLDNVLWGRERLHDLFGFRYVWEIYKPPAQRQFGAYTMPILAGDQLVGRMDARLSRDTGALHVLQMAFEPDFRCPSSFAQTLERDLQHFARSLGAAIVQRQISGEGRSM